jgi:hypothetical protein
MSLTNIKLPGFVIADLYRDTLIQPSAEEGFLQAMPEGTLPQQEVQAVAEPKPSGVEAKPLKKAEREGFEPPEPSPMVEAKPITKQPVPEPIIEQTPSKPQDLPPYKILGNNKKQITVVVNCPNDVFVPEADLQFLTKMLGACKLNMADVAIVNHAVAAVHIDRLKVQLQPKFLLLFGVEPDQIHLPINFPSFKEQPYAGTTYVFTPGLEKLNLETDEAKLLKRKLWDCLKRMFL